MALALVYGCRVTIWRYLDDEERAFLERIYPEEKFTEAKSARLSPQKIAEYGARVGWLEPVKWFQSVTNLNRIFATAVAYNSKRVEDYLQNLGIAAVDLALIASARNNNRKAMERMISRGATDYREASSAAASTGSMDVIELAIEKNYLAEGALCWFWVIQAAARSGQNQLLKWMRELGKINPGEAMEAMEAAAAHGQLETMKMVLSWVQLGGYELELLKMETARSGNIEAILHVAEWAKTSVDFQTILHYAARGGKIDAMCWAKSHGANNYEEAFIGAAETGNIPALKLLLEWGANVETCMPDAMYTVGCSGDIPKARWLIALGANSYQIERAFSSAASHGNIELMCVLRSEYKACNVNNALVSAAITSEESPMRILKMWGANNFEEVLERSRSFAIGGVRAWKAAERDSIEKLLEKWIKERDAK